jgi:putative sporulation protein YtaF
LQVLSIIIFAIALSFDGFGVGIAYGIKKIKIPLKSLLVISLTSSTAIGTSMVLGNWISSVVAPTVAEGIGALILIAIGGWLLYQSFQSQKINPVPDNEEVAGTDSEGENPLTKEDSGEQDSLYRVQIQIIRKPVLADIDHSGTISPKEAVFLGLALAMDALGAGIGAAMAGFSIILTVFIVGLVKFILVSLGGIIGRRYCANWLGNRATIFPGLVLIFLGLLNLYDIL